MGGQDVVEHGDRSPPMQFDDCIVVFAAIMAIYSWGRLPGMGVHVLVPVLIDDMPKKTDADSRS